MDNKKFKNMGKNKESFSGVKSRADDAFADFKKQTEKIETSQEKTKKELERQKQTAKKRIAEERRIAQIETEKHLERLDSTIAHIIQPDCCNIALNINLNAIIGNSHLKLAKSQNPVDQQKAKFAKRADFSEIFQKEFTNLNTQLTQEKFRTNAEYENEIRKLYLTNLNSFYQTQNQLHRRGWNKFLSLVGKGPQTIELEKQIQALNETLIQKLTERNPEFRELFAEKQLWNEFRNQAEIQEFFEKLKQPEARDQFPEKAIEQIEALYFNFIKQKIDQALPNSPLKQKYQKSVDKWEKDPRCLNTKTAQNIGYIEASATGITQWGYSETSAALCTTYNIQESAIPEVLEKQQTLPPAEFENYLAENSADIFTHSPSPQEIQLAAQALTTNDQYIQYRKNLLIDDEAKLQMGTQLAAGNNYIQASTYVEQNYLRKKYQKQYLAYQEASQKYQKTYRTVHNKELYPQTDEFLASLEPALAETYQDFTAFTDELNLDISDANLQKAGPNLEGTINYAGMYFPITLTPDGSFSVQNQFADDKKNPETNLENRKASQEMLFNVYTDSLWHILTHRETAINAQIRTYDKNLRDIFNNIFHYQLKDIKNNPAQIKYFLSRKGTRDIITNVIKLISLPDKHRKLYNITRRLRRFTFLCRFQHPKSGKLREMLAQPDLKFNSFSEFLNNLGVPLEDSQEFKQKNPSTKPSHPNEEKIATV